MAEVVYSQRLKPVLRYNGYRYHFHSRNSKGTKIYWRCVQRRTCKGRCITGPYLTSITILQDGTLDHQHAAAEQCVSQCTYSMKQCPEEGSHITSLEVVQAAAGGDSEEAFSAPPEKRIVKGEVDLIQELNQYTAPAPFRDTEVPAEPAITNRGRSFVMYDSGADDEARLLVFSTPRNLRYLSASPSFFCDGAFISASTQLAHLFTLYGVVLSCPVPLVYALSVRKQEESYRCIYDKILALAQESTLCINPALCFMDFEDANINAIREALPNAQVKGCLFHFARSLRWRISFLGLASEFNSSETNAHRCGRMLLALPFVPLEDVNDAFENIAEKAEGRTDDLISHFERVFVHGKPGRGKRPPEPPKFPPESWNVYASVLNGEFRITGGVEWWHQKIQALMDLHHHSIWAFIEALKDEQRKTEQFFDQMVGGHVCAFPSTSRQYRQRQARIMRIVCRYDEYKANKQIDLYLTEIARQLEGNPEGEGGDSMEESFSSSEDALYLFSSDEVSRREI